MTASVKMPNYITHYSMWAMKRLFQ